MNWTKETPSVPGAYLFRENEGMDSVPIKVSAAPKHINTGQLYAYLRWRTNVTYDGPVSCLGGEFYGPILPEASTPIYKRYIVFAFDACYPGGGLGDIQGSFDTLGEATLFGMTQPCEYIQIVDRDTWETLSTI